MIDKKSINNIAHRIALAFLTQPLVSRPPYSGDFLDKLREHAEKMEDEAIIKTAN